MATKTSQRVFIWVIAIVMLVGTIGTFGALILANENESKQAVEQQEYLKELQRQQETCPTGPVADKAIKPAPKAPEAPTGEDVTAVRTVDLRQGNGETVTEESCVELLYHGVLASDGTAFQGGSNYSEGIPYRSPVAGFVPGFSEGLQGMKVGGERQIFIPSEKAYGEQQVGDIPANADLIFTVRIIGIYEP